MTMSVIMAAAAVVALVGLRAGLQPAAATEAARADRQATPTV
jgi:hypothetical protein